MSKKLDFFQKILRRTQTGSLQWELSDQRVFSVYVFQPETVFRAFQSDLTEGGFQYLLLLCEKKYKDPEWDFEIEKYRAELAVVHQDKLVFTVTDEDVDLAKFGLLVEFAEETTGPAKQLLG